MVHPKGSHQGQELLPEPLAGTARAGAGVIHSSAKTGSASVAAQCLSSLTPA